jgi:folate-binding protein YgfZ
MSLITHASFHVTGSGFRRILGADRVDFIQRQTTNDLSALVDGGHISTVLTNPAARIIDVLQVFTTDDDSLCAITLSGHGPATALFLKKRVFFNDRVTVSDETESVRIVDVFGSTGPAASAAGIPAVDAGLTGLADFGGTAVRMLGISGPFGPVTRLVGPADRFETLVERLETAGFLPLGDADFNAYRVEAGLPGPTTELTEDFTPLETGLRDLVSDAKGCYTGQEVLARQITYDKITRSLAGIRLDGPARPGARVLAAEGNAGAVTSYANSPREGHIALAVLKRPHFDPGTAVMVETGNGPVTGQVVELPFSDSL